MRKSMTISLLVLISGCALQHAKPQTHLDEIEHVVIIYAENRSFDNLYGLFPGADGLADLKPAQYVQSDTNGHPLTTLPPVWSEKQKQAISDERYPASLPNQPFMLNNSIVNMPLNIPTRDLVHRFYQNKEQINGGRNDRFAAVSDAGGLAMAYYDGSSLEMWKYAREYTLADHFFMGAYGGSFLNHIYLVCACAPEFASAPPRMRASVDKDGRLLRATDSSASAAQGSPKWQADGAVTPDGYAVNTVQPTYQPSGITPARQGDLAYANAEKLPLPPQTSLTIGDTLSAKGVAWAWYADGWNEAVVDGMQPPTITRKVIYSTKPDSLKFQAHHQPFNYFSRFAPGKMDRAEHLKDGDDFIQAIQNGHLPQVAFYKPAGANNEHPGYTDVQSGDHHIAQIIAKIQASPQWSSTVIIVTYDENGGFWDHAAPPKGDRWGPGSRIPTIIISPHVKRGYVDHTPYDTSSIIKFLTFKFGLKPLPLVRSTAGDLTNAFN